MPLTWSRPANAPTSVNDSNFIGDLITLTGYNAAGWVFETTDPRGIVAANFYNTSAKPPRPLPRIA